MPYPHRFTVLLPKSAKKGLDILMVAEAGHVTTRTALIRFLIADRLFYRGFTDAGYELIRECKLRTTSTRPWQEAHEKIQALLAYIEEGGEASDFQAAWPVIKAGILRDRAVVQVEGE